MRLEIAIDLEAVSLYGTLRLEDVLHSIIVELDPATFRTGDFVPIYAPDGRTCLGEWSIE